MRRRLLSYVALFAAPQVRRCSSKVPTETPTSATAASSNIGSNVAAPLMPNRIVLKSATPAAAADGGGGANIASSTADDEAGPVQKRPATAAMTRAELEAYLDGPLRQTGLWSVDETMDSVKKTVDFRRIDELDSDIKDEMQSPKDDALMIIEDEEKWKRKLMFLCKFKKTPKHLTWKELGQEIECLDCTIEPDLHRPEELFTIQFQFMDKKNGRRQIVWEAKNDINISQGLTDLLAAIGSCLGRADVHRTIRFDDGVGITREISIRKRSRYTSDVTLVFRPAVAYNVYDQKAAVDAWEDEMAKDGMSTWGFHPQLMDQEYQDVKDPAGSYTIAMTSHAISYILLRCIDRLLAKPLACFYRPSQVARRAKARTRDDIGLSQAVKGWMGTDALEYPHYHPLEAVQEHWVGPDSPFTLMVIINKLREMTYLQRRNPEFHSWLGVRKRTTSVALRNIGVKWLGVGASTLFVPVGHNSTVNKLLPKTQQRRLTSTFSVNALVGMPDETRNIADFKKLTGHARLGKGTPEQNPTSAVPPAGADTPQDSHTPKQ